MASAGRKAFKRRAITFGDPLTNIRANRAVSKHLSLLPILLWPIFSHLFCLANRELRNNLRQVVLDAQKRCPGAAPGLAIVQVGGRDDSNVYIRMKIRAAAEIGIVAQHIQLPRTATQHELLVKVSAAFRWLPKTILECIECIELESPSFDS